MHDKIVHLCNYFKPNDIRLVYQGVCQEAGMNWRNLKLGKRKSMKMLAPYFAKACVDIVNAKTVIKVPDKIAIMKKIAMGKPMCEFNSMC